VRQHGVGKCRIWRKVHLAVYETSKDIIGIEVTTTAYSTCEKLICFIARLNRDGIRILYHKDMRRLNQRFLSNC
jgi:hypothetical protein